VRIFIAGEQRFVYFSEYVELAALGGIFCNDWGAGAVLRQIARVRMQGAQKAIENSGAAEGISGGFGEPGPERSRAQ
jgi:hypothetical protein